MMKRMIALAGAMLALLSLSGCLEVDSTISVKKDGSGTVTEKVVIGAQMAAMMKMGAAEGGEDPFANLNEESLKAKAKDYGEGVEFVSVKEEEKDGSLIYTALFKFADVSKLTFGLGTLMDDEETEEEDKVKFAFKDGVLNIMVPDPDPSDFALGDEEMSEEEMMMAAPMMAGMRMSAKVVLEDGIASTNATYHEGNAVTLFSMNFDELMKNEGGLKVMNTLQVEGREEFAKVVKEVKGLDIEHQEKVTIKAK